MRVDPTRVTLRLDPREARMEGITMHGGVAFDVPYMSEIVPGLWQGGCATGLVMPHFVQHHISLYPWEEYVVEHDLESQLQVEMYDSVAQGMDQVEVIAQWVDNCRQRGVVLVNCQAGLNRSSLVVARALMLEGMTADAAIGLLRARRSPACLCNPAFEAWLRHH